MVTNRFGGSWTAEKLEHLRKYLISYTTIFNNNERARYFTTTYLDAFAGTGEISPSQESSQAQIPLFDYDDPDTQEYIKGSARIALEIEPSFNNYVFLDINQNYVGELQKLKEEYPNKANRVRIILSDANSFLKDWCTNTNWKTNRAVVFLDPYGMQVKWDTVEIIAQTKAIDLWYLFPLSVTRLLPRKKLPPNHWAQTVSVLFGTDSWKDEFYSQVSQPSLFGEVNSNCKTADYTAISNFIVNRLKTVFTKVSESPKLLCNTHNSPIYLLCFAAGNPKGASTAVKIADYILKQ